MLHRQRQYTFGPQPLSFDSIGSAMTLLGYTDCEHRLETLEIVMEMDRTWLRWYGEQNADPKPETPNADS